MTLSQGRDIALIVLAVEGLILSLVPLAVLWLAMRGVQWLAPRLRRWLRVGYGWVVQAEHVTVTLTRWALAPLVAISSLRAGVEAGLAALRRR